MTCLEFNALLVYDAIYEQLRQASENLIRIYLEENLEISKVILRSAFRVK